MKKGNYKPKEFAEMTGVTVKTLQRWDREGTLVAHRTETDRRYYTYEQYLQIMGIQEENDNRKVVIYARVPAKKYDKKLQFQIKILRQYCESRDIHIDDCVFEYASGMNFERKQWNKLINDVMDRNVKEIIVAHQQIFTRYGFDFFKNLCDRFDTKITIIDNKNILLNADSILDATKTLNILSENVSSLKRYANFIEDDPEMIRLLEE